MFRIESHAKFINEAARRGDPITVNGVRFATLDGRVLSDPITERQTAMFDGVDGYALVRAEAPYEMIKALTPAPPMFLGGEGEPATSEADPFEDNEDDGGDDSVSAQDDDEPGESEDELDALSRAELVERLEATGREVGKRATKADIITLLRGAPTDD